jgi:hypothetical protein
MGHFLIGPFYRTLLFFLSANTFKIVLSDRMDLLFNIRFILPTTTTTTTKEDKWNNNYNLGR